MGIASWKYGFLKKLNRGSNQRHQNNEMSEVKSFQAQQEKKQPSTPEIVGSN
jgi:hypothetical protein